jgi:glucoamylase
VRELSSALIGNGSLLATISARGELLRLWWPHPDRGQHLGDLRLGLELDGDVRWLDEEPFEWTREWVGDSTILRTTGRSPALTVDFDDLVLPSSPVLVRRVSCSVAGVRLVVTCRPELDERDRGMGAFVDEATGAVVFHRTPYALALATSHDAESSCSGFGRVHGTIAASLDARVELVCAFGPTPAAAVEAAAAALGTSFEQHAEARRRVDSARLESAAAPSDVAPLYRRSLLVFDTLADAETGAVIAAPELDPDFVQSGGYGFVWPRDLAFLALAFLASRRRDLAERALRWLPSAQDESGVWLQRHWTDGTLAPAWCEHQLDETGSVLFAYEAAWRELRDARLDEALWPSARLAADALLGMLDDQAIPSATADLWEERDGCHSYTAAATAAGLDAAASFARRHEPDLEATYSSAAERVRCALDRCFWSDEHGRYLRTLADPTVDVSLLGLAWPFRAVDPAGERMRATADAVERALARPGGGLLRYEDDTYAGGNPWVLAALWLGLYRRQIGDADGQRRALAYAQRVATPLGLLAEQVTDQGEPAWVLPLAWSHALLVLSVRPELEALRARPAVARSPVRGSQ